MPATSAWRILAAGARRRHMRGRTRRRRHGSQTLALRYSAGPRTALSIGFWPKVLERRFDGQRHLTNEEALPMNLH